MILFHLYYFVYLFYTIFFSKNTPSITYKDIIDEINIYKSL